MKYSNYAIARHDSNALADYIKVSFEILLINIKQKFSIIYAKLLPNKFVRFVALLPMTLVLLSGFIHENEPLYSKTMPMTMASMYPLKETYLYVKTAPKSAMLPVNHEVSSFFRQFAPHDVPGHLYEHEMLRENNSIGKGVDQHSLLEYAIKNPESQVANLQNGLYSSQMSYVQSPVFLEDKYAKSSELNPNLPQKQLDPHNAPKAYSSRKNAYAPFIYKYAKQYNIDPKLVISIIYAESTFFPHLVSTRNAHGLMQVVPETAGAEVQRFLKKEGIPSSSDLIHPETNIQYGTAYLHLLRRYHIVGINNARTKDLITIASYNAGSGAVLRHFGATRAEAIANINAMTPEEVYESIFYSFRSAETRRYIEKVTVHMASL